jgi:hypothetical protein
MSTHNQNANEKAKRSPAKRKHVSQPNHNVPENLQSKKTDPVTGQTQYPRTLGYHGRDEEKNLNPEG